MENNKGISRKAIEECIHYIYTYESRENTKTNLLNQITNYLNNKFENVNISYIIEEKEGTFKIEGGKLEERLKMLNEIQKIMRI